MNRFFNIESPLMNFLNRVCDLLILNALFVLCCIPVVTIGASFTALHYVCYRMIRDEEGYITRDFFRSFRQNFRQSTLIWLLFLIVFLLVGTDMVLMRNQGQSFPTLLRYLIYADAAVVAAIGLYAFPLQARFENSIYGTLRNAALLTIGAFPRTLAMLVVMAMPFLILFVFPRLIPVLVMVGFSAPAYACASLYAPVFRRMEPQTEQEPAEDGETGSGETEPEDVEQTGDA